MAMYCKLCSTIVLLLGLALPLASQDELYFPPLSGNTWATSDPVELGWCMEEIDPLLEELATNGSHAFIVLHKGKMAIERYFDEFHQDSVWVWFSAGKSLTAFLAGLAQEQGHLDINASSSNYLGAGWSSLSPAQESDITIKHHLSMSTGLDYTVADPFCTEPACLAYLNPAGTHWYYHNAPYSLVKNILEAATGQNLNIYTLLQLGSKTGINGLWIPVGYNNFFFSTARVMARFGLLMLAKAEWEGKTIMADKEFYRAMISSSQEHNPAYGYLWWLNGKDSYKLPGSDAVFNGPLDPVAPEDMYCAVGAGGQIICVMPEEDIVFVRIGESASTALVPIQVLKDISVGLKRILCRSTTSAQLDPEKEKLRIIPNPVLSNTIRIQSGELWLRYRILDATGRALTPYTSIPEGTIKVNYPTGLYYMELQGSGKNTRFEKFIIP